MGTEKPRHRQRARQVEVRSPFDGRVVGLAPLSEDADVDRAIERARAAVERPLPAWRRADVLERAARVLSVDSEEFARTIACEAAKPIQTARVEVQRAVSTLTFSALAARTLAGDVVPMDASASGSGKLGFTLRVPVGVVAGVAPFNFPLNLVCHKVGPAIAAGAPIVLKPAEQTPLSALALRAVLVEQCGLAPDLFQVVTGDGPTIGRRLVDHADVAMVTFTGSPDVGWGIRAANPRKKVSLELGGNSPVILHEDADWRTAASKISEAGFSHAGQSCVSTQRIFVHRAIADAFCKTLVEHVLDIVVGGPLDERTEVSALISPVETARVAAWVEEACAEGASVLAGGSLAGTVYRPTVLRDVRPEMKVSACEVFGPVVGISIFDDVDEALRLANDSRYGLQAAIWTNQLDVAFRAARTLDFGGVLVNEVPTFRADQQPYGGVRDSGNAREGPQWAVREMTEERLVVLPA